MSNSTLYTVMDLAARWLLLLIAAVLFFAALQMIKRG